MTNPENKLSNPENEKGVRKTNHPASKFSASYWQARVFRPSYQHRDGKTETVNEWYCQAQHAGRREKIGLGTNSKDEAARRAARLYSTIRAKGWEVALKQFAPDKAEKGGGPTVGEFVRAVELASGLNPRTLRGYCVSFRCLTARAFGIKGDESRFDYRCDGNQKWKARIDRIRLDKLTPRRIETALARYVAEAGANPLAQQRARRSSASLGRQARALFSPKLLRKLPFESVPNPFAGVTIEGARPVRYVGTVNAGSILHEGREELAEADAEAYKALLLALGAGLRKREIDNLTWSQIDAERNEIRIQTTEHFQTKTADSEGTVFVDPALITELNRFRDKATALFVLESKLPPRPDSPVAYYRAEKTFDRLNVWLRSKGILAHKPLHTLRKEFGSLINAAADIYTASRQLRHASIAVTAAFYTDNRKRVAVPVGSMLALGKKAR